MQQKLEHAKSSLYTIRKMVISQRNSDFILILASALICKGKKEMLTASIFVYVVVLTLRKAVSHPLEHACYSMLYANFGKNEPSRARRYFRSSITVSTLVLILIIIFAFRGSWTDTMMAMTGNFSQSSQILHNLLSSKSIMITALLSLVTYTYKRI